MMLVDGFHGGESSPFCIPPWQQLALSLSAANGFLTESPQVVYLFVEVKRKLCGQDTDIHHAAAHPPPHPPHHVTVSSRKQCPQSISVILSIAQIVTGLLFIQSAAVARCSALTSS